MVNICAAVGGKVRRLTATLPARSAVSETMIRSDVAAAASMSTAKMPVPVCATLPVEVVVSMVPLPPGASVPALVTSAVAVVAGVEQRAGWLLNTLVLPARSG